MTDVPANNTHFDKAQHNWGISHLNLQLQHQEPGAVGFQQIKYLLTFPDLFQSIGV